MASVTLEDLWLHEAADNTVSITAIVTSLDEAANVAGEVRRYANGRLRAVSRTGLARTLDVGLELADRDNVDQLRTWVEDHTLLMLRDPLGRILWGRIFGLSVSEIAGADVAFADASFTFNEVSYDESV